MDFVEITSDSSSPSHMFFKTGDFAIFIEKSNFESVFNMLL